ncbi:BA14K family protein [Rhizobium leguminosarum bv. viciae]|uniref:Lectin-like protein BA14k n=1 Tax=Rhizobium leguminosarum bv. viciae TaxID=387 RepID=A0A4V2LDY0_RHILV|nr:BA14K family protein [Rhizobium leguminosarum]ASR05919.1 BA14K family protein [Rhizobium leguminosarum bv. viciae]MBY5754380.1 BA14K family protein [Rhizobium leguminosarum]MBY5777364.1 BA14K family protein [Rhizobium leguminosarum]MBY5782655.1 BA14K family protein [Rhizobium leguminosarum]MBY5791144.1 BA14K family protein [Rhizobium leguminosarum]
MNRFAVIALSIATAFSGMPASAGPVFVPSLAQPAPQSPDARIMTVACNPYSIVCSGDGDNRRSYRNRDRDNDRDRDRRSYRDRDNDRDRYSYRERRYDRDDRYGWDRRYDRRYRRYDNRYDNNGAIIGGLAAGALLGGIIASQPRARAYGSSHAEYCYSRYRSYRAYDNTYQPNYGPRRQCR